MTALIIACLSFLPLFAALVVAIRIRRIPGPALAPRVRMDEPPKHCPGCLACDPPDWLEKSS